jgi:apolipoprotein N-acyltransferase
VAPTPRWSSVAGTRGSAGEAPRPPGRAQRAGRGAVTRGAHRRSRPRRYARPPELALLAYGYLLAAVPIGAIAFGVLASSPVTFLVLAAAVPLAFAAAIVVATFVESRAASAWAQLLVFPCFAVVIECLLGTETIGVPATIALTQADHPLLIQNAEIFGTAGTTFLLLLVNRCWPLLWQAVGSGTVRDGLAPSLAGLALFVINAGYGSWALHRHGADAAGATVTVAAVQPVVPSADYVNRLLEPAVQARIDRRVERLVREALRAHPDLLVVSEGGNGRYNFRVPQLRRRLERTARRGRVGLIVSSPDMDPEGRYYNALFSLAPDGRLLGTYRKRLLTPVGERHLSRGIEHVPLPSAIGPVGAMVCFESCFAGPSRDLVRAGARYLLVSTSDASFRNSPMALLHTRFSVFRAIETRRYLVQAANTGPSLVVRPTGAVLGTTRFLDRTFLAGQIEPRDGATLFVTLGPIAPAAAAIVLLLVLLRSLPRFRSRRLRALRQPPVARPGWDVVAAAISYVVSVVFLACTSVHLASRDTKEDRGPIRNLAAFLAPAPVTDVRAASVRHLQREANTCGPAALSFLLRTYGLDVPQERIAAHVRLEDRGTTLLELARAAERLNLEALRREQPPAIAHLPALGHFVVVLQVRGGWVYLFDPATGPMKIPEGEFATLWNGYTLSIRFGPVPEIDGAAAQAMDVRQRKGAAATQTATASTAGNRVFRAGGTLVPASGRHASPLQTLDNPRRTGGTERCVSEGQSVG